MNDEKIAFVGARAISGGSIRKETILIEGERILGVEDESYRPGREWKTIDASGLYASSGFIEMHSHGAAGSDYMDGTDEAYDEASEMHLSHGVTSLLPTTVASSFDEYIRTIRAFKRAKERRKERQDLIGLHFEGPFFPVDRAGGMKEDAIMPPDKKLYEALNAEADGAIRRWTAAPELDGGMEFGDFCRENGMLASIGHTNATYPEVKEAIGHGYSMITHLYSDMSSITRKSGFRVMGTLEAAYAIPDIWVEVIADGCHIPPDLFKLIHSLIGRERITICSDSIRPAGTDEKIVLVGSKENPEKGIVEDGVAKFLDRSAFLGSIKTGSELIEASVRKCGIPLEDAVLMFTENPAKALGLEKKGSLDRGKDADIVLLDEGLDAVLVMKGGRIISDKRNLMPKGE